MEKELLTKAEVIAFLRISKRTLDLLMRRRDIPFFKLDRKVLFKRQDIEQWLETKRVR
jgi:excisionase family DNA binding protein